MAVKIGVDEVDLNDLVERLVLSGIYWSFFGLFLFQEVRQVRFLSVLYLKIVIDHGVPQSVQCFQLSGAQCGFSGKIPVERESGSFEVLVEVVHSPGSGGCLQEEPGVIFLVFSQLSGSVRDGLNLTKVVSLGQGGAKASRRVLVWRVGIGD